MRSLIAICTLAAVGTSLIACANQPTVPYGRTYHDRWPDFFAASAVSNEIRTRIWGQPFAASEEETERVVLGAMRRGFNNDGFRFSTAPAAQARYRPYVTVLFNGPLYGRGFVCSELPTAQPAPAPGRVRVVAAMCRGNTPLTSAVGELASVESADDPRFVKLMNEVARKVFERPHQFDADFSS